MNVIATNLCTVKRLGLPFLHIITPKYLRLTHCLSSSASLWRLALLPHIQSLALARTRPRLDTS